ncbi:MAG: glycosyltransferase family 4 protein, partial [bacterium]|nr:glycosyltransferase family 4 protein [bacterium]
VERHLGRKPAVIHPPVYGTPPYPRREPDADGLITMINPSPVKGVSIFLELVDRFPHYEFAALRGWGTTAEVQRQLKGRKNITMLRKCKHIETVLMRTKILLMPALWYEGFGLVVMEAMLRGVPVLASNQGSLVEAKQGTRYILPVQPIESYKTVFDENRMPIPVVPLQDVEPWAAALKELMEDPALYRRESDAAREAALRFVPTVKASQFEEYLENLQPARSSETTANPVTEPEPVRQALDRLSPERRALLLRKVRKRGSKSTGP